MSGRTFIDSNILLYAHDWASPAKQFQASDILAELWDKSELVLSRQVLQEFYVNVTRKLAKPLPRKKAREVVEDFSLWCVETSPEMMRDAFSIEDSTNLSFWDALIVAAAVKSGATRILSEDLSSGQRIRGIKIENPFAR